MIMGNGVILDLCGGTGSWSKPYRDREYDTLVVDLEHPDPECGSVFGDVTTLRRLPFRVIGVLCAPPCTYFAVSGNRWKRSNKE